MMKTLAQFLPILFSVSLGLLVMAIGMTSTRGDLVYVLRRPGLLARAVLAIDIVPPLAAVALIALMPGMPVAAKAGIFLMCISPLPPVVPGKALRAGGDQSYVYGLQVAMALLAIVTVPLLGAGIGSLYDTNAVFPIGLVAQNIFMIVLIPLAIGIALGRWLAPEWSQHIGPPMSKIVLILVVIAFLPILAGAFPRMIALIGDGTIVGIVAVIAIITLAAHLLGPANPGNRTALVFAATTRHPGIALALAGANHSSPDISAAVLLFLLVSGIAVAPYQILVKRAQRRSEAKTA